MCKEAWKSLITLEETKEAKHKFQYTRISRVFRRNRTRSLLSLISLRGIFFTSIRYTKTFQDGENAHRHDPYGPLDSLARLFRCAEWGKARARRVWSWSCHQRSLLRTNCSDRSSVAKTSPNWNWRRRERDNRLVRCIRLSWPLSFCFREHERNKMIYRQEEEEEEERTRSDDVVIPEEKREGGGGVKSSSLLLLVWSCRLCACCCTDISTCVYV